MSYKLIVFWYFYYLGFFYTLITSLYEDLHLSGFKRSVLMGIIPVLSFFANILWGRIADKFNCRILLILIFSLTGAVSQFFLFKEPCFYKLLILSLITGVFIFPLIPLNDALVISYNQHSGKTYGSVRVWGTISFMLANFTLIFIYKYWPVLNGYILYSMPLSLLLMSIPLLFIDRSETEKETSCIERGKVSAIFTPLLVIFLVAVFFQNMGFSGKFTYFSAHLKIIGFSPKKIAFCWGLAPVGEIIIFLFADKIIKRFGYYFLLCFGIVSALIRWLILTVSVDFFVIASSQVFYSFAFGGYYAASMALLKDRIPQHLRNTGQGVFAASVNLAMVSGNIIGGVIFDYFGSREVFVFSSVCAVCAFFFAYKAKSLSDKQALI